MSFADGGLTGSEQSKVASTSFFFNTTQVINVGDVHAVYVTWDNQDTANADTTRITVTDTVGNTYTRIRERTQTAGVVDDGLTSGLFVADVTTQIPQNTAITVAFNVSKTAKTASGYRFTKAAGSTLTLQAQTFLGAGSGQPAAISLSGMPSREYLLLHLCAIQAPTTGIVYTQQAGYSDINPNGSVGGSSNTNQSIRGGWRIATVTGDTVDVTLGTGAAHVQILAALYEVGGGGSALTLDLSDSVALADSPTLQADLALDLSDTVPLADSPDITGDFFLSLDDTVPVSDSFVGEISKPCMPDAVCGTHLCGEAICGTWWACPAGTGMLLGGHPPDDIFVGQPPVPSAGLYLGTTIPGLVTEGILTPPQAGLQLGGTAPGLLITTSLAVSPAGLYLGGEDPNKVGRQYLTPSDCEDIALLPAGEASLALVGAPEYTIVLDEQECR